MDKKFYESPEFGLLLTDTEDVIRTSPGDTDTPFPGGKSGDANGLGL